MDECRRIKYKEENFDNQTKIFFLKDESRVRGIRPALHPNPTHYANQILPGVPRRPRQSPSPSVRLARCLPRCFRLLAAPARETPRRWLPLFCFDTSVAFRPLAQHGSREILSYITMNAIPQGCGIFILGKNVMSQMKSGTYEANKHQISAKHIYKVEKKGRYQNTQ